MISIPKKGEKARKLKLLSSGKGVRPPKIWFDKIKKEVKKEYAPCDKVCTGRIIGGIWAKMPLKTKKKIVVKYQK